MPAPPLLLAPHRGSVSQFVVTTLPLLAVLLFFLYEAWEKPLLPVYNLGSNYTDDEWQAAMEETGDVVSLMDILWIFLFFHVLWTMFAVYLISFVPKRRRLIGRYFSEGEVIIGDVLYDKNSRSCGKFHDYGYALYSHPTQRKLVRKRVRVYQPYHRERIAILRLPNRPLSGQSRIDLEIDLSAATRDRDTKNKPIGRFSVVWALFTLLGSIFVLYQMSKIRNDQRDRFPKGLKVFLVMVGLNLPLAYLCNWARFLFYRNWMVNRGAIIDDGPDSRHIPGCVKAQSMDGSDIIPYTIFNEDDASYQGTIPSHSGSLSQDKKNQKAVNVSIAGAESPAWTSV